MIDLSGGSSIAGSNVMVGGAGGQLDFLTSYRKMGLPPEFYPNLANQTNNELGLVFQSDSGILRGILANTQAATRAKVEGAIFCAESNDDTGNNPHNPIYWLYRAGVRGELSALAGTQDSESGGRSMAPPQSIDPTLRPVRINRPQDALNLINFGKLSTLFPANKAQNVLKAIERLSATQMTQFSSKTLPQQIQELINCGYIKSSEKIGQFTPAAIDAALDTDVTALFNMANDQERRVGTLTKLLLDGHLGAATVEKGGHDYHDASRATGEQRDLEVGNLVGKAISLAARKGKNLIVYVFTDGAVSAQPQADNSVGGRGKFIWTGDSGDIAASFMLVYKNTARATLRVAGDRQVGQFKMDGSGVDRNANLIGNSVTNLAKVVVANYLSLHGEENRLTEVVGDNPFGGSLNQYLIFNRSLA
jgi:hypothetical protein